MGFEIGLGINPASALPSRTIEEIRQGIQHEQVFYHSNSRKSDSDGVLDRTVLEEKMVDGIAISGFREERTHDSRIRLA